MESKRAGVNTGERVYRRSYERPRPQAADRASDQQPADHVGRVVHAHVDARGGDGEAEPGESRARDRRRDPARAPATARERRRARRDGCSATTTPSAARSSTRGAVGVRPRTDAGGSPPSSALADAATPRPRRRTRSPPLAACPPARGRPPPRPAAQIEPSSVTPVKNRSASGPAVAVQLTEQLGVDPASFSTATTIGPTRSAAPTRAVPNRTFRSFMAADDRRPADLAPLRSRASAPARRASAPTANRPPPGCSARRSRRAAPGTGT